MCTGSKSFEQLHEVGVIISTSSEGKVRYIGLSNLSGLTEPESGRGKIQMLTLPQVHGPKPLKNILEM